MKRLIKLTWKNSGGTRRRRRTRQPIPPVDLPETLTLKSVLTEMRALPGRTLRQPKGGPSKTIGRRQPGN